MTFDGSAIQALLDGAVAKGAVHGVSALVVDRQGVLFQGTAGEARADTMYRNASMTKAVATTAALQLVEQGLGHRRIAVHRVGPRLAGRALEDRKSVV